MVQRHSPRKNIDLLFLFEDVDEKKKRQIERRLLVSPRANRGQLSTIN
jgi:hypothetical protein